METSIYFSNTLKDTNKQYKYVLHLSDIHIRTGDLEKSRYDEYEYVFQEFYRHLDNLKNKDDTVIVITGDIFHHKGKIEPSGIRLAQIFMDILLKHMDVILVCGNHDYRQDDIKIPDMIETIYKNYIQQNSITKYKVFYLNKTGYYKYNNIGFSVVDIRDTLNNCNTYGKKKVISPFPNKSYWDDKKDIEYNIGLFHGTILPSRLVNNLQLTDGYDLEWFGDYPYLLLGDNHRQQVHSSENTLWGYSGSLIQQDFGEHFGEHGYLIWDLENKISLHHPIFNNYGFCTIKNVKNELYIHKKLREWNKIDTVKFPKYPSIRVFNKECFLLFEKYCKENNISPKSVQIWNCDRKNLDELDIISNNENNDWVNNLEELNTSNKWLEYISKYANTDDLKQYIIYPENLKLPLIDNDFEFSKKYKDRNIKIQQAIDEYTNMIGQSQKNTQRIELLNMNWSYLMCYGANNYFDFNSMKNKISLLNGKNAIGKSSFLDVICIGLYGEPTKMRNLVNGKKMTDKIIHDNKPVNKTAPFVKILFKMGDNTYEIYRAFGKQAAINKKHLILQTSIQIFKVITHNSINYKELVCEGSTLVNKWVSEHIGDMESILMSTVICQIDLNNFFHLKQDSQKHILDKALRLDTVSIYGKILKESLLGHKDVLQHIKTTLSTISKMKNTDYEPDLLDKLRENLDKTEEKIKEMEENINEWSKNIDYSLFKENEIPKDINEIFYELNNEYVLVNKNGNISDDDIKNYHNYAEKINRTITKLEEYKDIEIIDNIQTVKNKWLKKYEKFMVKQPKCDVSIEWIENSKTEYNKWIDSDFIKNTCIPLLEEKSVEEWKKQYEDYERRLIDFVLIEKPKTPIQKHIKNPKISKNEYDSIYSSYNSLIKNIPSKPYYIEQEYINWRKEYNKWEEKYKTEIKETNTDIQKKYDEITIKIDTYEEKENELEEILTDINKLDKELQSFSQFEYNPECWACNKNPYKIKEEEIKDNYSNLQKYSKQLQSYIKKIVSKNYVEKWKELQNYYKIYLDTKDIIYKEKEEWDNKINDFNIFKEWENTKKDLEDKIELYKIYENQQLWKIYEEQNKIKEELTNNFENIKNNYNFVCNYVKEKEEWSKTLDILEKYKETYEMFCIWNKEHQIIKDKLEHYDKIISKIELQTEYDKYKEEYAILEHKVKLYLNYKKHKSMYYYSLLNNQKKQYEYLLYNKQNITKEIAVIETQDNIIRTQKKMYDELQSFENLYITQMTKIKKLNELLMGDKTNGDGYKEWIYKHQVIPLLNNDMNIFLQMFEDFTFEMSYDKNNFIYMLNDRGNKPTLDKSSGYQNFIIGLALRIILTRIGAVGQQLKHLFIDEGFTACDSVNIEKVPILLESILKYGDYHSILIMSHLDSVKDCISNTINIVRKDPFSFIEHGEKYTEIDIYDSNTGNIIPKKQRGRPKTKE